MEIVNVQVCWADILNLPVSENGLHKYSVVQKQNTQRRQYHSLGLWMDSTCQNLNPSNVLQDKIQFIIFYNFV